MGMRHPSYKAALVLNRFVLQHHYHQGAVDRQTTVAYMYQEGLEAEVERHYKLDAGTTLGVLSRRRGLCVVFACSAIAYKSTGWWTQKSLCRPPSLSTSRTKWSKQRHGRWSRKNAHSDSKDSELRLVA